MNPRGWMLDKDTECDLIVKESADDIIQVKVRNKNGKDIYLWESVGEMWWRYDQKGREVYHSDSSEQYDEDDGLYEEWQIYDDAQNKVYYRDSHGNEIEKEYDQEGRLIYSEHLTDRVVYEFEYLPNGNKIVHCTDDTEDRQWWKTYDPNGNELHYRDSNKFEYWINYDHKGREVHYKSSEGNEVWWNYDADGREVHKKDNAGREELTRYDDHGNEVFYRDSSGRQSWREYQYDKNGNIISTKDSDGKQSSISYDSEGRQLCYRDSDGYIMTTSYSTFSVAQGKNLKIAIEEKVCQLRKSSQQRKNEALVNTRKEDAWQIARVHYKKNQDVTSFEKYLAVERFVNEVSLSSDWSLKTLEKLEATVRGLDAFNHGVKSLTFARPTVKQMLAGFESGLEPKDVLRGYTVSDVDGKPDVKGINRMGVFFRAEDVRRQAEVDGVLTPRKKLEVGDSILYYTGGYISCLQIKDISEDGNSIIPTDLSLTKNGDWTDDRRLLHLESKRKDDGNFVVAEGSRLITDSEGLQRYLRETDEGLGFIIQDAISNGLGKIFVNPVREVGSAAGQSFVRTSDGLRFSVDETKSSQLVSGFQNNQSKIHFVKDVIDAGNLIKDLSGLDSRQIETTVQQENVFDTFIRRVKEAIPQNATKEQLFIAAIDSLKVMPVEDKIQVSNILAEKGATTASKLGSVLQQMLGKEEKKERNRNDGPLHER